MAYSVPGIADGNVAPTLNKQASLAEHMPTASTKQEKTTLITVGPEDGTCEGFMEERFFRYSFDGGVDYPLELTRDFTGIIRWR